MDFLAVIAATDAELVLHPVCGQPLLSHTIHQARKARRAERICVVTPSSDIAGAAVAAGAEAIEVRDGLSAEPSAILARALAELSEKENYAPAAVMLLDPAFPLTTASVIDGAWAHLLSCGADTLISVHVVDAALWFQDQGQRAEPIFRGPKEHHYVENGVVLLTRTGPFGLEERLPAGRTVLYEISPLIGLRMPNDLSWSAAEALMRSARSDEAKLALRNIRLLALDFDGVMTDNRVLVFEDGREAVLCSRGDGMGLEMLRKAGLDVVVISKEGNPVVTARCRKLKLPCMQGVDDKLTVLKGVAAERGIGFDAIAFMGNDINDLECMRASALAIAPSDSHPLVMREADLITSYPGGFGAVREICDLWIATREESAVD